MTVDLENGYEEYLTQARVPRGSGFITWVNRWFALFVMGTFTAFLGLMTIVWLGVLRGNNMEVSFYYLAAIALVLIVLLVWFRGRVRRETERVQGGWCSLLDRLMGRYR